MLEIHLLLLLLLAHLVADFFLQPKQWVAERAAMHFRSPKLRLHVACHMALSLTAILIWQWSYGWSHDSLMALGLTFVIGVSHFMIDSAKSYFYGSIRAFLLDQVAHLAVIVWLWSAYCEQWQWLDSPLWTDRKLYLSVIIYLLLLNPSSFFIGMLLKKLCALPPSNSKGSFAAGHYIGILERLLIASFVMLGELSAVGFLLASKSIFRFGDLTSQQERHLTEYVLLGTLISTLISLLLGLLLQQIWH